MPADGAGAPAAVRGAIAGRIACRAGLCHGTGGRAENAFMVRVPGGLFYARYSSIRRGDGRGRRKKNPGGICRDLYSSASGLFIIMRILHGFQICSNFFIFYFIARGFQWSIVIRMAPCS